MDWIKEVEENVDWLSSIGADPAGGMTRLLYDENWLKAQHGLKDKFSELGMEASFDAVGNLFGRIEGSQFPNETILSGSHVDTVVNGGKYDGQYGIIAAYLAMKSLVEEHGQPLRSIEVVSLAEEEGSRFPYAFWGSKNLVKEARKEDVLDIADTDGVKFVDAMRQCGFDFDDEENMREDIKAFVEIHIEQGSVLETEGKSIGVVTSIVGQKRYNVTLKGQANHAGTTPMGYRKDAVYGFSKICSAAIDKAKAEGDPLVLTFGKVEPKPNTVNVVPGEVLFTVDCRHTDQAKLDQFTEQLEADMKAIAAEIGLEIDIDLWMSEPPVPMDKNIIALLEEAAKKSKANYRIIHSGAGHDSQIIAPRVPTGMIFVPSIQGISHNPAEATELNDLAEGVKMLAAALYELAYIA
ncbi:allantoate deiminase [Desemzia incerta]|uniref:allantoate deiminase n=1 Tax=Desemzia incerta TaxID=82801 RepID=UPI0033145AC6